MKAGIFIFILSLFAACKDSPRVKSFTWQELGEPEAHEIADREAFRRETVSIQSDNSVIIESYMISAMSEKWKPELRFEDDTLFYREEARDPVKKLEKYKFTWVIDTRRRSPKMLVFRHEF